MNISRLGFKFSIFISARDEDFNTKAATGDVRPGIVPQADGQRFGMIYGGEGDSKFLLRENLREWGVSIY